MRAKVYLKILFFSFIIIFISSFLFIYFKIKTYDENRVYDVRKIDKSYRLSLINNYIDKKYQKNSILILGDSQTNGDSFTYQSTFAGLLSKKLNKNVIILAFKGARVLDNYQIVKYLIKQKYKFDAIIFDVNQGHTGEVNLKRLDANNSKDYTFEILFNQKSFLNFIFNPNPKKDSKKLPLNLYKPHHMGSASHKVENEKIYFQNLLALTNEIKQITKNIVFYTTPRPWNNFKFNSQNDKDIIKNFNQSIKNFCKIQNITYLEPKLYENIFYIDIVHFNKKGHKEMANLLEKTLKDMKIK
ncbi:SGNH/GDSL hydrolase family protein [Campylobacter sp. FMV-PI01]|uniref:SGNH/GDSL hydrolase family protein n=1 Tax=Campylobacter portucalensis TaxID=2608384 RepID=A0A6L5WK21_9BACT|nr:SGNH/GDSL hydrolase family protein [Campylobacter portucalensis]MSN96597.1 SGNH/GDSL hydrolase family protein [Campylobacter portucalensis]